MKKKIKKKKLNKLNKFQKIFRNNIAYGKNINIIIKFNLR